jgi:hypothetical protein
MAALLAVLALALAVGGAQASGSEATAAKQKKHKKHKKKKRKRIQRSESWLSTVTLHLLTPTHFEGTVGSDLGECRSQRLVAVYYTDPETRQVLPLSVQRSDHSGRYAFDVPNSAYRGSYQALLIDEVVKPGEAPQTCLRAESIPLIVGSP